MNCQHRGCPCGDATIERDGKKFCSEKCAEMETTGHHASRCACGYSSCAAA